MVDNDAFEKLAEKHARVHSGRVYFYDFDELKNFAEAYHKAKCEQAEPVAWMEIKGNDGLKEISVWQEPVSDKSIPLYTAPKDQSAEIERLKGAA